MGTQLYGPGSQQTVTVTEPNARNSDYSYVTTVAPGATVTLISLTATTSWKARGFNVTGNGDGFFVLYADSIPLLSGRISNMIKSLNICEQDPISIPNGVIVTLKIKNEAETSCDYEGVVLGV